MQWVRVFCWTAPWCYDHKRLGTGGWHIDFTFWQKPALLFLVTFYLLTKLNENWITATRGIYCLMSEQIALVDFHIYVRVHLEGVVKMTFSTFQPLLTWLTYKEEFSWSSNQPILSHNRDLLLMLSCLRSGFWQNKRVYWKTFDGCRWRWYEETPHYDCSQFWFSLGKQM